MRSIFLYTALILYIIPFSACKSPPSSPESQNTIVINVNTLADNFGNNDGVTSETEIDTLNNFFNRNEYAWFVAGFPVRDEEVNENTAGLATYSFQIHIHPYPSEQDLRIAYEGIGIKTPYVGIIQLGKSNVLIIVINYFRASGPNISHGEWEQQNYP